MKHTNDELLTMMKADTPLNRARQAFSSACAEIEQAALQRRPPSNFELRRMEFEATEKIIAAFNSLKEVGCSLCHGKGEVFMVGSLGSRMDRCWECKGTGTVVRELP